MQTTNLKALNKQKLDDIIKQCQAEFDKLCDFNKAGIIISDDAKVTEGNIWLAERAFDIMRYMAWRAELFEGKDVTEQNKRLEAIRRGLRSSAYMNTMDLRFKSLSEWKVTEFHTMRIKVADLIEENRALKEEVEKLTKIINEPF